MTSFRKFIKTQWKNPIKVRPATNAYVQKAERMLLQNLDEDDYLDSLLFHPRYIRLLNTSSKIGVDPTGYRRYGFQPLYFLDPFKKKYDFRFAPTQFNTYDPPYLQQTF